jgi:hypothetical protein
MKYNPPYGVSDPNAPYVNGDPSVGRAGSIPPAESIEYPQREIVSVIADVGLSSPNNSDLAQMSAATRFMRPQFVIDQGTMNHIRVALNPTTPAWLVPLSFFVQMGQGNTNSLQVVDMEIIGIAAKKPVVKRTGAPVAIGDLIGGTVYLFTYDGTNVRCTSILNSEYQLPEAPPSTGGGIVDISTGNRDYYIDPVNGNDANDGSTLAKAWRTRQYAYNWVQTHIDLAGYNVVFHCSNGTYAAAFTAVGFCRGQTGPSAIKFIGNEATPSACLVSFATDGGIGFGAIDGAKYTWSGFKIQSSGQYCTHTLASGAGSELMIGAADFGVATSSANSGHIACGSSASLVMTQNYTVSGSSCNHMVASGNGTIICIGLTINHLNNPNFSVCYASAQMCGVCMIAASSPPAFNTYIGGCTGPRYLCNGNGTIFTYSAGGNYVPGSVGGYVYAGGQYF